VLSLASTKKHKYDNLVGYRNLYLPRFTSLAISEPYVDAVYRNEVFFIRKDHVKRPNYVKKCVSAELMKSVNDEITKQKLLPLGIDETCPPNKEWLIDILYTLNPDCEFFTEDPRTQIPLLLDKLKKE